MDQTIAAGQFKAKCLHLLDQDGHAANAAPHHQRGNPVSRLVPVDDPPVTLFGRMAGTIRIVGAIVSRPLDESEWRNADAENVFGDGKTG
jgi:hypothetical protein